MSRRALILEELGLNPVWVRKEILAELKSRPVVAAPAPVAAVAAVLAQGLSPVAVAAHQALAPLVKPPKFTLAAPAANDPVENERAKRIAIMSWDELNTAVSTCTACPLCINREKSNSQTVFGAGVLQPDIMVLGEAPDTSEEATPFSGEAGKLLANMLAAIGVEERVYQANILKCRTPNKRNPQAAELEQCAPFLKRQIELVQPRSLFIVGRLALKTLLNTDEPVSALRENLQHYQQIPTVVSYNPTYLLRNLPDKSRAWQDLLLLQATLKADGR